MAIDLTGNMADKRLQGASALVLSGELTEGVSDLSEAMTAPGGVPALREVNQDRSHPDAPLVEEQPKGHYRRLIHGSTDGHVERSWDTVSPSEPRIPDKTGFPDRITNPDKTARERAAQKPEVPQ